MDTNGLTKVFFKLDPAEWHGLQTESLWAEPLAGAQSGDVFVIKNSPFYSRDVSYLDVVRAVPSNHTRGLDFAGRIDGNGHSTYRLIVQKDWGEFKSYWDRLEKLGCTYESGNVKQGTVYSVDVPDTSNIYDVYAILEDGQKNDIWMFEEGHVGHKLKS